LSIAGGRTTVVEREDDDVSQVWWCWQEVKPDKFCGKARPCADHPDWVPPGIYGEPTDVKPGEIGCPSPGDRCSECGERLPIDLACRPCGWRPIPVALADQKAMFAEMGLSLTVQPVQQVRHGLGCGCPECFV
jgi:hypothetical protein